MKAKEMAKKKVLAISSAGGHWVQLRRLRLAWVNDCNVTYVTTKEEYRDEVFKDPEIVTTDDVRFVTIVAANRWQKLKLIWQLMSIAWLILKIRPDVVISTGAAAGYFALRLGKMMGARTIWVDSIANAEVMSLSGQRVEKYADLWLTQWEHLSSASENGPQYKGAVV